MSPEEFRSTLKDDAPPEVTPLLKALWWDAQGDWKRAHKITQEIEGPMASLVHAFLHRREGDIPNARYWYDRAGRVEQQGSLEAEWDEIATELLSGK